MVFTLIENFSVSSCIQDMSENNMNQQPQPLQQSQPVQSTSQQQNNQNQDLVNCDLANLESLSCNDSDELLRQLTENTFELETFFSEFSTADIKVRKSDCATQKQMKYLEFLRFRRRTTTTWSIPQTNKTITQIATTSTWKPIWRYFRIDCWHQLQANTGST